MTWHSLQKKIKKYFLFLFKKSLILLEKLCPKILASILFRMSLKTRRTSLNDSEKNWQHKASKFFIHYGEKKIQCYRWGKIGGKRILLIHGWDGKAMQFKSFLPGLIEQGYDILSFDGPGHGHSDGKESNLFEFSQVIDLIGKKYGPFYAIMAHSGGVLSAVMSLNKKEWAEKIVCLSALTRFKENLSYHLQQILNVSDEVINETKKNFEKKFGSHIWESTYSYNHVSHLQSPFLFIHDEDDQKVPIEDGLLLADHVQKSSFIKTKGLGHRKILSDKYVLEKVFHFLAI